MIEFVGGKEILNFAEEEGFKTIRMTFEYKSESRYHDDFNVFEISEEEFEKMCNGYKDWFELENDTRPAWKDEWGWWKSAGGCNLEGSPTIHADINGNEVIVWYDSDAMREDIQDWIDDGEKEPVQNLMAYWIAEHCKYKDIFEYCSSMWGASTEKNITAIAVGLAKLNNMSLANLFSITS